MTDTNKYSDFDTFMSENALDEIHAKVKGFEYAGEQYVLPEELSAAMVLRYTRKASSKNDIDKAAAVDTFLNSTLGEEQYERLLDTNIGLAKMMRLVEWIFLQYDSNPKVKK